MIPALPVHVTKDDMGEDVTEYDHLPVQDNNDFFSSSQLTWKKNQHRKEDLANESYY